ncbi:hypothetical protein Gpo141_00007008 [Globisporangium polare]
MADAEANGMEGNGGAATTTAGTAGSAHDSQTQRGVRGRYAKFNGGMDVLLLEAMREHNPFTAKHGTRLQMWQNVAELVGEELFKNPEAYSWHTCRDRVTALMKMYADGKHDKLFKHGTVEENTRKEAILRELSLSIARKSKVTVRPAASLLETSVASGAGRSGLSSASSTGAATRSRSHQSAGGAAGVPILPYQKRRRLESSPAVDERMKGHHDAASVALGLASISPGAAVASAAGSAPATGGHLESDAFRARVLSLIESKVQFDMEQRIKETELREQEFELQKRFLEYLQSK